MYVADYGNHRIQHFDRNLNFRSTLYFREQEDVDQRFGYPRGVAVSRLGDLFLTDGENSRILKIINDRTIDKIFGGVDAGEGRLKHPSKLRISDNDLVYVQDGNILKVFDLFGNYLRTLGTPQITNLRSFTLSHNKIFLLDSCTVWPLSENGEIQNSITVSGNQAEQDQCNVVDLAIRKDTLYALTQNHIVILPLHTDEADGK